MPLCYACKCGMLKGKRAAGAASSRSARRARCLLQEDTVRNINEPVHPGARPNESTGRPVGVILIAVVCFFFVVALAGVVLQTLLVGGPGTSSDAALSLPWLAVALVLLPVCVAAGVGLLLRRNWARYLVVIGMVAAIVGLLVRGLGMSSLDYGLRFAFSGSLLPAAIILYLLHPSIRATFQR